MPCLQDGWDTRLPHFDNNDDYGMESQRVRAAQASRGVRVRFTYVDYVVKIVLGAILRKYFNLDQGGRTGGAIMMPTAPVVVYSTYGTDRSRDTGNNGDCCGCTVM